LGPGRSPAIVIWRFTNFASSVNGLCSWGSVVRVNRVRMRVLLTIRPAQPRDSGKQPFNIRSTLVGKIARLTCDSSLRPDTARAIYLPRRTELHCRSDGHVRVGAGSGTLLWIFHSRNDREVDDEIPFREVIFEEIAQRAKGKLRCCEQDERLRKKNGTRNSTKVVRRGCARNAKIVAVSRLREGADAQEEGPRCRAELRPPLRDARPCYGPRSDHAGKSKGKRD